MKGYKKIFLSFPFNTIDIQVSLSKCGVVNNSYWHCWCDLEGRVSHLPNIITVLGRMLFVTLGFACLHSRRWEGSLPDFGIFSLPFSDFPKSSSTEGSGNTLLFTQSSPFTIFYFIFVSKTSLHSGISANIVKSLEFDLFFKGNLPASQKPSKPVISIWITWSRHLRRRFLKTWIRIRLKYCKLLLRLMGKMLFSLLHSCPCWFGVD